MKKKLVLALILSTCLAGCSNPLDTIKAKIFKDDVPEIGMDSIPEISEEFQMLEQMGVPDENGDIPLFPMEDTVSTGTSQSASLIEAPTSYPGMVVTLYDPFDDVNRVTYYRVDPNNRTAIKYMYDREDGVLYNYYDNYQSLAYSNKNASGWELLENERVSQIVPNINPSTFTETNYVVDGNYITIDGTITPSIDNTMINAVLKELFDKDISEISLHGIYKVFDNSLVSLRFKVTSNGNIYTVAFTPMNDATPIIIPDNVLNLESGVDKPEEVKQALVNIPNDIKINYIVYGKPITEVDNEVVKDKLGLIASELQREYNGLDLQVFLNSCVSISEQDVEAFMANYTSGAFSTLEEKAAADVLYKNIIRIDNSIEGVKLDKIINDSRTSEEQLEESEEVIEEPEEELLFADEAVEETEEVAEEETEEVVEETAVVQAKANIDVNVRKGPGTNYEKIDRITKDTVVTVVRVDEENSEWSHVILPDGTEGCIKSEYLTTIE